MKTGVLNHIKFKKLKRLLKVPTYAVAGVLESIWQLTAECADDGHIGKYDNDEIASYLDWDGDADELIESLVSSRWLDRRSDGTVEVHDWSEHAPTYIKDRLRMRNRRLGGDEQNRTAPNKPEPPRTGPNESPPSSDAVRNSSDEFGKVVLTQLNPTQPSTTQPNQPGTQGVCDSAVATHTVRTPPGFHASDCNGTTSAVAKAMGAIRGQNGGSPNIQLGPLEKSWLSQHVEEIGAEKLLAAWKWLWESPCERADYLRTKQLATPQVFLSPEKFSGYVDLSLQPDAWKPPPDPKVKSKPPDDFTEQLRRTKQQALKLKREPTNADANRTDDAIRNQNAADPRRAS